MSDEFKAASNSRSGYSIAENLARTAGGETWEAYKRAYPKGRVGISNSVPELKKK